MTTKTCGECRKFGNIRCGHCEKPHPACIAFEPKLTNGDKIRQMSNEELVVILTGEGCKHCIYRGANFRGFTVTCHYPDKTRIPDCNAGILAWLNAPAESEER